VFTSSMCRSLTDPLIQPSNNSLRSCIPRHFDVGLRLPGCRKARPTTRSRPRCAAANKDGRRSRNRDVLDPRVCNIRNRDRRFFNRLRSRSSNTRCRRLATPLGERLAPYLRSPPTGMALARITMSRMEKVEE
jgi:hypothetical protein